jgi:hypothetical protein
MQAPNAFNHARRFILRVQENVKAGWIRRVMDRSVEILFDIEFALFPL